MKGVAKTIDFDNDSDPDDRLPLGSSGVRVGVEDCPGRHARDIAAGFQDAPSSSSVAPETKTTPSPAVRDQSSPEWDSLLATPMPGSSPLARSKPTSRKLGLSPIRFSHDGDTDEMTKEPYSPLNESGIGMLPTTPVEDHTRPRLCIRAGPNGTPLRTPSLQQSLRRMKLNDGLRSPLRGQKTFPARDQKFKTLTSSVNGGMEMMCRPIFSKSDELTPISGPLSEEPRTNINPFASNQESIRKKGLKRLREEYDWYVFILVLILSMMSLIF